MGDGLCCVPTAAPDDLQMGDGLCRVPTAAPEDRLLGDGLCRVPTVASDDQPMGDELRCVPKAAAPGPRTLFIGDTDPSRTAYLLGVLSPQNPGLCRAPTDAADDQWLPVAHMQVATGMHIASCCPQARDIVLQPQGLCRAPKVAHCHSPVSVRSCNKCVNDGSQQYLVWDLLHNLFMCWLSCSFGLTFGYPSLIARAAALILSAVTCAYTGIGAAFQVRPRWIPGSPPASRKVRRSDPLFDPGQLHQNDCFYAAIAYGILQRAPTKAEVTRLRGVFADLWSAVPRHLLAQVARQAGHTPDSYIQASRCNLWRGLPDLQLLNATFACSARVYTAHGEVQTGVRKGLCLRHHQSHYTVQHAPRGSGLPRLSYLLRPKPSNLSRHFQLAVYEEIHPGVYPCRGGRLWSPLIAPQPADSVQLRGGVFLPEEIAEDQLSAQSDQDEDTETHLLSVLAICTEPYHMFRSAVQQVCAITTVMTELTVGYYHSPGDDMLDYIITDAWREPPLLATYAVRCMQDSWIMFDSLLRLARVLQIQVHHISLINIFDDPTSWDWRLPPQGFNTAWATQGRRHVIVIDYRSTGMMVFTMGHRLPAIALTQYRGGIPEFPLAVLRSAPHLVQPLPEQSHRGGDPEPLPSLERALPPLEEPAFVDEPPEPLVVQLPHRALFAAHVLLHNGWLPEYAATLHRASWALGLVLAAPVGFEFHLDDILYYFDNSPPLQLTQQVFSSVLPFDNRAGIAFLDLIARAQHQGHVFAAAFHLQGDGRAEQFPPATFNTLVHWEPTPTAWANRLGLQAGSSLFSTQPGRLCTSLPHPQCHTSMTFEVARRLLRILECCFKRFDAPS
eukprot:6478294-Amphidinium_carterae.3